MLQVISKTFSVQPIFRFITVDV